MYGPHSTWSSSARLQAVRHATRATCRASSGCRSTTGDGTVHSYVDGQQDRLVAQADRRRVLADPRLHVPRRRPVRHRRTSPKRASSRSSTRTTRQRFFDGQPAVGQTHRGRRPALPRRRRRRGRVRAAQRPVRRHLGAVHDGEDRRLQAARSWAASTPWRWRAGQADDGADPRRVQLAAAARRAARSEGLQGDRRAVRDQVRAASRA